VRLTVPPPADPQPLDRLCTQSAVSVAVATVVGFTIQRALGLGGLGDLGSVAEAAMDAASSALGNVKKS
jgi:hypothetical protein